MEKCAGECGLVLFENMLYTCVHCTTDMCLKCSAKHLVKLKFEAVTIPKMVKGK